MTYQFVPSTVTGGGSTTLTVATTTSTPKGKYTLAIRATDSTGELTHLQQVSLRVR
jgi:aminopeptidase S